MADYRYRPSGRRSPTLNNPARSSMPTGLEGYGGSYGGDLHAVPTSRYDASIPRRPHEHRDRDAAPHATITTYNVMKDAHAPSRTASLREPSHHHGRLRSSTVDSGSSKPVVVTTTHGKPHTSSHSSSSGTYANSPPREPRRWNDTYYAQPASSMARSRSQNRHSYSHGYGHSTSSLDNDEYYRLRDRVGGDLERIRAPSRAGTADPYRSSRSREPYSSSARPTSALVDYEDEGYEYTKPGELAKYDLDNERPRRSRRESIDRPAYYRPHVNVSHDASRYEPRGRGPPPTSAGLERYNRSAAPSTYERPSVAVPSPPSVPAPAGVEPVRRVVEPSRGTSIERRNSRSSRPVSLYQDPPTRMSHPDDIYRPRDDERLHRGEHRSREDIYRDENVASRGFGVRTDLLEQADRRPSELEWREFEGRPEGRPRRDAEDRSKRSSDEELSRARSREPQKAVDTARPLSRLESRDRRDSKDSRDDSKESRGDRVRDKLTAGLGVAAAAIGLGSGGDKDKDKDKDNKDKEKEDGKGSPRRRRDSSVSHEPSGSRDRYRVLPDGSGLERKSSPREDAVAGGSARRDSIISQDSSASRPVDRRLSDVNRKSPPKADPIVVESRSEAPKERSGDRDEMGPRDRDYAPKDDLDAYKSSERKRDLGKDDDSKTVMSGGAGPPKTDSPPSQPPVETKRGPVPFNPTDTNDLMSLKAELAAMDEKSKEKPEDKPNAKSESKSDPIPESKPAHKSDYKSDYKDDSDALTDSSYDMPTPPPRTRSVSISRHRSDSMSRGRERYDSPESRSDRLVSPPRDKNGNKTNKGAIKGILKQPKVRFPEDENPIREGVAPHKDDKTKKDVPAGARWTKINRKMVNPEALTDGKERFEVRDDFVIVLRVLSKDEIQAYATKTAQLREKRRKEYEENELDRDYDRDFDDDDDRRRRHRRDDRERHRRQRGSDEDEPRPKALEYDTQSNGSGSNSSHYRRRSNRDLEHI